jgi:integrase
MSKFGKSREVPLHASTLEALQTYLQQRDQLYPRPTAPSLFIYTAGTRLLYCGVHWTFLRLVRQAGLQPRSARCRPRPHDLRHSFAVRTVLDAYRADANVAARLPVLSTYLGHLHPPTGTGICRLRQSCWLWPASVSNAAWRRPHECPRTDAAGLLH